MSILKYFIDNLFHKFQNNPCYNESQASLKCQISNPGDNDACQRFIDNYKLCLDFWKNVRNARRAKNLIPGIL